MKTLIIVLFSLLQISCSTNQNEKIDEEQVKQWNHSTKLIIDNYCDTSLIGTTRFLKIIKDDSIRNILIYSLSKQSFFKKKELFILEESSIGRNIYLATIWTKRNEPIYRYRYIENSKELVEEVIRKEDENYEYLKVLFTLNTSESCTFDGENKNVTYVSMLSVFKENKIDTKVITIN